MERDLKCLIGLVSAVALAACGNVGNVDPNSPDLAGDNPVSDAGSMVPADGPGACSGPVTTAGVQCAYVHDAYNGAASVKVNSTSRWSCTGADRQLTANGIPDHDVGTFPNPNCPNTIRAYSVSASMTLTPAVTSANGSRIGVVGYAFNGVKFDPSTAGTCSVANGQASCSLIGNTGSWNIEALGQSSFNFGVDASNAHVQPTGEYHYHGMPQGIIDGLGKGQAMTLVGFALDGFPIYAKYGYSDPKSAASAIKAVTTSYRVKESPDANRPSTASYPLGAFTQDYEYVAGLGDLDECNGRTGVTPEFPCGIYHYFITDSYPFIQRCVKGTPTGGGMMGPPPDGGMVGGPTDGGMMGLKACAQPADCVGACPPGSKGCTCGQTPMGMVCVPTCTVNADCPAGMMGMQLSCRNGVCGP